MKSIWMNVLIAAISVSSNAAPAAKPIKPIVQRLMSNIVNAEVYIGKYAVGSMRYGSIRRGCLYTGEFKATAKELDTDSIQILSHLSKKTDFNIYAPAGPSNSENVILMSMFQKTRKVLDIVTTLNQICDKSDDNIPTQDYINRISTDLAENITSLEESYKALQF